MLARLPDALGSKPSTKYFTLTVLLFVLSFLILPSSKMVNNFFYAALALPAVVWLPRFFAVNRFSWIDGLWLVFLGYFATRGLLAGDFRFVKHVLYVGLFVFVLRCLVRRQAFESGLVLRTFFWASAAYVALNAVWLWLSGELASGERIIWLSGRMAGPIYTSMWIALCFGLCLLAWVRENRKWELSLAMLTAWFLCGYVLQSRSGLVGLSLCLLPLLFLGLLRSRRHPLVLVAGMFLSAGLLYVVASQSPTVSALWSRGDSYRLELWGNYVAMLDSCGIWQGCGTDFSPEIELASGIFINHPHNVYLSLALYGGLPGVVLFGVLMSTLLFIAIRTRSIWGFALLLGLIMVNFDGHRVLDSPNELWLLLLLPAGLVSASVPIRPRSKTGRVEQPK